MKRLSRAAICAIIAITSAPGCAVLREDIEEPSVEQALLRASYYGSWHAGRLTASGEVFNPEALTAAHRYYPFGTVLQVTNPDTGRSVRVRVNDRGPFVRGRSLDLSRRAAREIGLKGVQRVLVQVLSQPVSAGE